MFVDYILFYFIWKVEKKFKKMLDKMKLKVCTFKNIKFKIYRKINKNINDDNNFISK